MERHAIDCFRQITAANVADFCLDMYRALGLLEGVRVVRSGDPAFRRAACEITDFFADVPHEGEIVRARFAEGALVSARGRRLYVTLPDTPLPRSKSAPRATPGCAGCNRSCTAHITLRGRAKAYLHPAEAPDIPFVNREPIDDPHEAYTELPA